MNPRCRNAWLYWIVASAGWFAYLEATAYHRSCHKTLSRELQWLTGVHPRKPWGRIAPFIFALLGGWLSHHVLSLKELPAK